MAQLNAQHDGRYTTHKFHHTRQGRLVGVIPQPHALRRDAPFGHDPCSLDDQHGRARHRQRPQMHDVPIGHRAIDGAVLAHGRHGDAVAKALGAKTVHISVQHAGHGMLMNACIRDVNYRFIHAKDEKEALAVDQRCVKQIPRPMAWMPVQAKSEVQP